MKTVEYTVRLTFTAKCQVNDEDHIEDQIRDAAMDHMGWAIKDDVEIEQIWVEDDE